MLKLPQTRLLASLCGLLLLPALAAAQEGVPPGLVRILVGFSAGGATDIAARLLQPHLQESLGRPVVVENRTGANGSIATEALVRATPDGTTLMMSTPGQLVVNPYVMRVSYSIERDVMPLAQVTGSSLVVVVPAGSGPRDLKELLERARAHPGRLSFGSGGIGGSMHLAGETLNMLAGLNTVHVPYRGTGPAVTDLTSGTLDYMITSTSETIPLIQSGQLRALAVTGPEPNDALPGVPVARQTIPGFVATAWTGMVGPARMPEATVAVLAEAMRKAIEGDLRPRFRELGSNAFYRGPEQFRAFLDSERQRAQQILRKANLTIN
jgi:tripartite-type tricarboxylate transporter receptor subunit TctC